MWMLSLVVFQYQIFCWVSISLTDAGWRGATILNPPQGQQSAKSSQHLHHHHHHVACDKIGRPCHTIIGVSDQIGVLVSTDQVSKTSSIYLFSSCSVLIKFGFCLFLYYLPHQLFCPAIVVFAFFKEATSILFYVYHFVRLSAYCQ